MKDEELIKLQQIAAGINFDSRFLILKLVKKYQEAKAENNRLKVEIAELQRRIVFWRGDMNYQPEKERAEAIKEFVDKFIKGAELSVKYIYHYPPVGIFNCNNRTLTKYYTITAEKLENIIKEMAGDAE